MIPYLYSAGTLETTDNGIGALSDAVSCVVTENRNGAFELEMRYPIYGVRFDDLDVGSVISADANPHDRTRELFDVYQITKPLNGIVTVRAQHISYRLAGVPVPPFTAGNAADAFIAMKRNSQAPNGFTFTTDNNTQSSMIHRTVLSFRQLMGGVDGSILDCFGGEWKYTGKTCRLCLNRGQNRGVQIRYGKNLTGLSFVVDSSAVHSGVCAFWSDAGYAYATYWTDGNEGSHPHGSIAVDCTGDFDTRPTTTQLLEKAQAYATSNNITAPKVSIDVNFALLSGTQEYADYAILEQVYLCDTVTVIYEALGVNATAKVIQTVYNCLLNRYTSLKLGDTRNSIASTVKTVTEIKKEAEKVGGLQQAVKESTEKITGNTGGYVKLHDSDGDGAADEILIMDSPTVSGSTNVWRWNQAGLGFSSTGYSGDNASYSTAMTADGQIVADRITTGTINAAMIKMLDAENECGIGVGTGSTDRTDPGASTTGAMVWGGSSEAGNAKNYLLATNAGVRMSSRYDKTDGKKNISKVYVSTDDTGALAHMSSSNDADNYARVKCQNAHATMMATGNSSVISNSRAQVGISQGDDADTMLTYLLSQKDGTTYSNILYAPTSNTVGTSTRGGSVNSNAITQTVGTATATTDTALTKITSTGRVDIASVKSTSNDDEMCGFHCNSGNKSSPYAQMLATGATGTSSVTARPDTLVLSGGTVTVGTASKGLTVTENGATVNGMFVQFGVVSITSSTTESAAVSYNFSNISGCSNFKQGATPYVIIQQPFSSGVTLVTSRAWNGFTLKAPVTASAGTRQVPFIAFGQRQD